MPITRPPPQLPLLERIAALRAEIDALFDELAENDRCGLPLESMRQMLTARSPSCQCRAWLIHSGEVR
jgi:hypothetical protein